MFFKLFKLYVPRYQLQFSNNGDLFIEMLKTQRSVMCCILWNKAVLVVSSVMQRSFKTYQSVHNGFVAEVDAC